MGIGSGRKRQCFRNAGCLAERGNGAYCEGFALGPDLSMLFHHAWITLDGTSAIDVTLPDGPAYKYFGVAFGHPRLIQLYRDIGMEHRVWPALLDLPLDGRVVATLRELEAAGLL